MEKNKLLINKIIITFIIIMSAFISLKLNVNAAKKQKLVPSSTSVTVGDTITLTYKNAPKKIKKTKVNWKITSGKQYVKIKVSKNKKKATITALKAGKVSVQLKYKKKKIGTVKIVIENPKVTTTTEKKNTEKKTTEKKTTEKKTSEEKTTEAPKTEVKAQYSYAMYLIQPEGANWTMYTNLNESGWTNNNAYYIYIKTDNPDPSTFALVNNMGSINTLDVKDVEQVMHSETTVAPNGTIVTGEGSSFKTASTKKINTLRVDQVSGGYAFKIDSSNAGDLSIDIYERSSSIANGEGDITDPTQFTKVCSYANTFVNYAEAYKAEVNRLAELVKSKYGNLEFKSMCSHIGGVMWDEGYSNMDSNAYTWTRCGILIAKRLNCATGSDFVADVCKALGADSARSGLANSSGAHERVYIKYQNNEWSQESGFNTCTFDEELITKNKPDLSKLK